jgi:hypothetical protein
MFRSRLTLRHLLLLGTCVALAGLLLAPGARLNNSRLRLPGSVAEAVSTKSYEQFIEDAYQGAYHRHPDCTSELQPEFDRMVNAAANGALLEECKRFVATLFETQASYNAADYATYLQTPEYQQINPQDQTDFAHQQSFITDLYHAFLQREPEPDGLAFWTNNVISSGRKQVIIAFEVSIEFGDQVNALFQGLRPSCSIPDDGGGPCVRGGVFYGRLCP